MRAQPMRPQKAQSQLRFAPPAARQRAQALAASKAQASATDPAAMDPTARANRLDRSPPLAHAPMSLSTWPLAWELAQRARASAAGRLLRVDELALAAGA